MVVHTSTMNNTSDFKKYHQVSDTEPLTSSADGARVSVGQDQIMDSRILESDTTSDPKLFSYYKQKQQLHQQQQQLQYQSQLNFLQFHIRMLYFLTALLVVLFISASVVCFFQITALKGELSSKANISELVSLRFWDGANPMEDVYQYPPSSSTGQMDGIRFSGVESADGVEGNYLYLKNRIRRQADDSSDGDNKPAEPWTWMNSFSRVSVSR